MDPYFDFFSYLTMPVPCTLSWFLFAIHFIKIVQKSETWQKKTLFNRTQIFSLLSKFTAHVSVFLPFHSFFSFLFYHILYFYSLFVSFCHSFHHNCLENETWQKKTFFNRTQILGLLSKFTARVPWTV